MSDEQDLDFTRPAKSEIYDAALARRCFEVLGSTQSIAQGQPFFAAGEASDRMYLLLEGLAEHVIFAEGDSAVFMYIVLSGRVAISIRSKVVEMVGPGGVFGEMALVDQSARAATAKAETACSLLAINRSDFLALVRGKPAFGVSLLQALAERLRYMTSGG